MGKIETEKTEIRLLGLDGIGQLKSLYGDFFAYNAKLQPKYYKESVISEEYPKSVILSKEDDIFVAVRDGIIVGFIHVQENKTPPYDSYVPYRYAEIIELFVAGEFRKLGIGAKLFDAVKVWSKGRGLAYIEAMVLAEAEGEIMFYEKKEFKKRAHIIRCEL